MNRGILFGGYSTSDYDRYLSADTQKTAGYVWTVLKRVGAVVVNNEYLNNDLLLQRFCKHQFDTIVSKEHQDELKQAKAILDKFKKCKDLQNSPKLNVVAKAIQLAEDRIQNSNNNGNNNSNNNNEDLNGENNNNKLNDDNNNINNNIYIELEKEEPITLFNEDFPDELISEIFSYLSFVDLVSPCCLVSKDWKRFASDTILLKKKEIYTKFAFGNDKWAQCFGDDVVKDENKDEEWSSLPLNISGILESSCPIFPGEKIKDTHMLVRLPKTLNGGLTLKSLGELAKKYFSGSDTGYRSIWIHIARELGDKSIDKSRWVLMTKNVFPGSRRISYAKQQKIVADLVENSLISYEVPETLESAACILSQYFSSNTRLFSDNPLTYTRCKEKVEGYQTIVGSFAPAGLFLSYDFYDSGSIGVAALRKF